MKKLSISRLSSLFTSLLLTTQSLFSAALENPFSTYVKQAVEEWGVPGLAIAVIKDGEVYFEDSHGLLTEGRPDLITAETKFAIGSITKSMVATLIATLVEEGKLDWDDRVTKYLPNFTLENKYAAQELRIRDLLSHRSGIDEHAGDLLFLFNRPEVVGQKVGQFPIEARFRSQFRYQNITYQVAGEVIKQVTGRSWQEEIQQRVFSPLEMENTFANPKSLAFVPNVATPHVKRGKTVELVPWEKEVDFGPAGGICSTLADMEIWMKFLLSPAKGSMVPRISEKSFTPLFTPQIFIANDPTTRYLYPETKFMTYGLGWYVYDYQGKKVIEHSGNIPGMSAKVLIIPEERLGVVVLCNEDQTLLPHALCFRAADTFSDQSRYGKKRDWSRQFLQIELGAERLAEQERLAVLPPKKDDLPPVHRRVITPFLGVYRNELLGEVVVIKEGTGLVMTIGSGMRGKLEQLGVNRFQVIWEDLIPRIFPGNGIVIFSPSDESSHDVTISTIGTFNRQGI
jgi:CubicO group peptidase (beta-lactamase class C family)